MKGRKGKRREWNKEDMMTTGVEGKGREGRRLKEKGRRLIERAMTRRDGNGKDGKGKD